MSFGSSSSVQSPNILKNVVDERFDTLADMIVSNIKVGRTVKTCGYNTKDDGGAAEYRIVSPVAVDGYGDHLLSNGNAALLVIKDGEINAKQYGMVFDGVTNDYAACAALEAVVAASYYDVFFPEGVLELGANSFPFRNAVVPPVSFKDYGGARLYGAGFGKTVIRTTSAAGKDVLQVNGVKNLSIKALSVTAVLTGSGGSGSNGLSVTHGAENLDIDIEVYSAPGLDKTSFMDGGKAFTLQSLNTTVLPFKNVKIRGRAKDCVYGFGIDAPYEAFNINSGVGISGIDVDVIVEDCWRGCVLSAPAATASITELEKDSDVRVNMTCINVAQPLISARWVGGDINVHVANTKLKADLFRPFAADLAVYGAYVVGVFSHSVNVSGKMRECDNKLIIGAASQAFSVFTGSKNLNLNFSAAAESVVSGNDLLVLNVGGNVATNSNIVLAGITDTTYIDLLEVAGTLKPQWQNTIVLQAKKFIQDANIQKLIVEKQGAAYNAFEVDAVTGLVSLPRLASGSAGVADGYITIKDSFSGADYKIQLYT